MIIIRIPWFSRRRRRRRVRLPFSNRNAELLVADLPVRGLASLATVRNELAPSAVLEHGTVTCHAAVGALLGREGVFLRSHHHAPGAYLRACIGRQVNEPPTKDMRVGTSEQQRNE